jgi:hypothetical protein
MDELAAVRSIIAIMPGVDSTEKPRVPLTSLRSRASDRELVCGLDPNVDRHARNLPPVHVRSCTVRQARSRRLSATAG